MCAEREVLESGMGGGGEGGEGGGGGREREIESSPEAA